MKTKSQGIYKIIHIATGRFYIGSAVNFGRRFKNHIYKLNNHWHNNPKLQQAWNTYGPGAFAFKVVEFVEDRQLLLVREQFYLDTLHPHYNIALFATSPMLGRRHSPETKERMRAKRTYIPTQEVRAKISASLKGRQGKRLPLETRQVISDKLKSHVVSHEARQKVSNKNKGRRHTEEAKHKISEASKRQIKRVLPPRGHSDETRQKISSAMKGKSPRGVGFKHSEETKQKMRLAKARRKEALLVESAN